MEQSRCPICGQEYNCNQSLTPGGYYYVNCKSFNFTFLVGTELLNNETTEEIKEKAFDLITEHLLRHRIYQDNIHRWQFFYEPSYAPNDNDPPYFINIADKINSFPTTAVETANRALMNLATLYPQYGKDMIITEHERRLLFSTSKWSESPGGILALLLDMELIRRTQPDCQFRITAKGWEKIDSLLFKENEINQGFVAMAFKDETRIIREAYRQAITKAGFSARFMDEFEHNNQIVPEMLHEIEKSKFILIDVTYPNFGAYYEAGYAQALKKEVIVCCRESEYITNPPHFDIAQRPIIRWTNENDLMERVKKRIEATVTK